MRPLSTLAWRAACIVAAGLTATAASAQISASVARSPISVASSQLSAGGAVVAQHVPEIVKSGQAKYLKAASTEETLKLAIQLPSRNQEQLDALLADLYNPQSPNFHKWLTSQEFDIRFGPKREDFNTLVSWAQAKGMTVTYQAANGRLIEVEAPVSVINRAFHVVESSFHDSVLNRDFHAPDREPTTDLPFALLAVDGLEDSQPKVNHLRKSPNPLPETVAAPASDLKDLTVASVTNGLATSNRTATAGTAKSGGTIAPKLKGSGPSGTYLPSDIRVAYYGAGNLTGQGQTVGIFSFDGYLASDLALYFSATGMKKTVPVNNVLVNNFSGNCVLDNPCDDGEQILDIVNVMGMAPGLSQILFYENNTTANVILAKMASDNIAKVISCSWGGGGFGMSSDTYFQQMAAQGQSFLSATGDDGAFYRGNFSAPSFDPYITQVGGTDLTTVGRSEAWSSEVAWDSSGGGYWITGISSNSKYTIPAYQSQAGVVTAANKASSTYRNVPDIAAEADFDNPTVSNGALELGYGGTSFAAPRMAGYMALANQQAQLNNMPTLGFLNNALYAGGVSAKYTHYYHDVASGDNPAYPAGTPTYYSVTGYDLVTGWGSPNGEYLIDYLAGNPAANFSIPNYIETTIIRGTPGQTQVPVTGYNGYSGQVGITAVSGLPSGWTIGQGTGTGTTSVPLSVVITPPSTAVEGTYPINLTITDTTNSKLTQTTTIAVVIAKRALGDFTLSTNPIQIPVGSTGTARVLVTPQPGLTEAVSLEVSGLPQGVTATLSTYSVPANTPSNVAVVLNIAGYTTPGVYNIIVKGTTAEGMIHHVTLPLTVSVPTSLLVNGGFDTTGITPWQTTTSCGYNPLVLDNSVGLVEPQSGTNYALLLSTGEACTQGISQKVTIPAGSAKATLSFWDWILTGESSSAGAKDTLTVTVTTVADGTVHTLGTLSNLNAEGYWTYRSFDMTPYIGQTVRITFTGVEAGATVTDVLLDSILLVAQ